MKLLAVESDNVSSKIPVLCPLLLDYLKLCLSHSESTMTLWPVFRGWAFYDPKAPEPAAIPLSHPPFVSFHLSEVEVSNLIDLTLEAVRADSNLGACDPTVSSFIPFFNQGLILRDGYIFERISKHGNTWQPPFFADSSNSSPQTSTLLSALRCILPLGPLSTGMILVRVTNFPQFPSTMVSQSSKTVTPWHCDKEEYGQDIFSLTLTGSSALVFAKGVTKQGNALVHTIAPDTAGFLWYWKGSILLHPFIHAVPQKNLPRISITWRPLTKNDVQHDLVWPPETPNAPSISPPKEPPHHSTSIWLYKGDTGYKPPLSTPDQSTSHSEKVSTRLTTPTTSPETEVEVTVPCSPNRKPSVKKLPPDSPTSPTRFPYIIPPESIDFSENPLM